jgi:hypothetical protein
MHLELAKAWSELMDQYQMSNHLFREDRFFHPERSRVQRRLPFVQHLPIEAQRSGQPTLYRQQQRDLLDP